MSAADPLSDALPLVAALAEELAFALTSDLMVEQYRQPSRALDHLSAAKTFLEQHHHSVGPCVQEVVEVATAQGGLLA
ncbi:hypothetical protein FF100_28370 [Methylobacterium terricola]|uniref:Uncharacterized protein n=1 Tax=Methylobacterium terricola TaxID=2583531 RepID=A0A5C4LB94_9HYPH|nr:hypothetical protein [Methylobacterium terricola]TNC08758.1 hypothetical protein FF100_28370 [Methylobacterium terricola]